MPIYDCPFPSCGYQTADVSDALAATLLQIHASGTHVSSSVIPSTTAAKVDKIRRPTVSIAGTSEDWSYFLTRWEDYKDATKITGKDIAVQLLECCDDDLRKDLTRSVGGSLTSLPEQDILKAIKPLAVREENTMVARVALYEMRQDRDETIRSFGARIRGQAGVCKYTLECPTCKAEVNYTDQILRDVLTRGVADSEIQLDLLGHPDQNMSLEDVFLFVEAKEAGKRSANKLFESQGATAAAARSQYRRQSTQNVIENKTNHNDCCIYCGKRGHGKKAPPNYRKIHCSAYNHQCEFCNRLHHTGQMCRSKDKAKPGAKHTEEAAIFDTLCALTNEMDNCSVALDHHTYCQMNNMWKRGPSKQQPQVDLSASTHPDDYNALGFELNAPPSTIRLSAVADTGCQSCLIGANLTRRLGIPDNSLIPVNLRMRAVNDNNITILGAIILRLSGTSTSGQLHETREMVYVTNDSDKLFLSREACTKLGLISTTFPTVGETIRKDLSVSTAVDNDSADTALTKSCNCPRRALPPPKPDRLPFPATEANRERLQKWLLEYYRSSTFNTCQHQPLPMMEGPPLRIMINPDADPVAYHTPIPVPLHWQEDVKSGLLQDTRLGVIEPVPVGEPVTWCHRMVICAKKNGQPRRTVDFQPLNAHAVRETHHTQSPYHQARLVPPGKKKTVFDCWNGYHSVPLHEDDRHLTTFITPWGRYRYRVAPQGYAASGDGYSRRFDEIVSHINNKTKCVDDTLLWSDNIEDSFFQAIEWLDICGRHGITLNPEKFTFASDDVTFAGFEITTDSVRPCRRYLDAIQNFPPPKNVTDVRSWFGLINQVAYAFSASSRLLPFRSLLKPNTPFEWTSELQQIFEESKAIILSEIEEGVRIFDKTKPTCLATDWSKSGIGFWLMQKHCSCPKKTPFCCRTGWKTTLVGSRFTHAAESRYAPIEGEALAVADALEKTRFFVLGCKNLTIAVDHKPLLKVLGDRSLNDIPNNRLRNLKERTLRYRFSMVHIPGVKHKAADTLSRYPTGASTPTPLRLQDDVANVHESQPIDLSFLSHIRCIDGSTTTDDETHYDAIAALDTLQPQAITWNKVRLATSNDPVMQRLLRTIEDGFPTESSALPADLREYIRFRDLLSTVDGVVLYKNRIVIPRSLRQNVLATLHSAHQGVTSMTARAESAVFWPGITSDINDQRTRCHECNRNAPSQPSAPPTEPILPSYPFQCICADYFKYQGKQYLVIVDRYSNWIIIERAQEGAKGLVTCLRRTFATYGIPDECASDGGPEFTATITTQFLHDWGVHHRLSSVAYPHSNTRAEVGVKTAKRLIASNTGPTGNLDTNQLQRAVLQYRNTPDPETKLSPAMCIFGRPIKDFIPIQPGRYQPHPTWIDTLKTREEALRNRHQRVHERLSEHTKRLMPLSVGDHVRLQNQTGRNPTKWDRTGIVIEVRQFDQYAIRIDGSGRITLRNRKFLRKYVPVQRLPPRYRITDDLKFLAPAKAKTDTVQAPKACVYEDDPPNNSSTDRYTSKDIPLSSDSDHGPIAEESDLNLPNPPPKCDLKSKTPSKPPLALRRLMDYNAPGKKW